MTNYCEACLSIYLFTNNCDLPYFLSLLFLYPVIQFFFPQQKTRLLQTILGSTHVVAHAEHRKFALLSNTFVVHKYH